MLLAVLELLGGLWVFWIAARWYRNEKAVTTAWIIVLLCMASFVQVSYPFPQSARLAQLSDNEKASKFMADHLKPGSRVFACSPRDVWNAKQEFVHLAFEYRSISEEKLVKGIEGWTDAVYVNKELKQGEPILWSRIEGLIGTVLDVGFMSHDKTTQVLPVRREGPP